MRKSLVVAGKRVKLEGNRGSVLIKGLGVVSVQVDQFVSLSEFLKIGRTAEEIKKSYGLSSTVAAKRLVREAQTAGVKISKYTSEEPRAGVGRQPNVYQLTEFVTPPKAPAPLTVTPPAGETPAQTRSIDDAILNALKAITTRMDALDARTLLLPKGAQIIPNPNPSNGHPGR